MDVPFYGRCDTFAALLTSRYHSLNRQIEKSQYHAEDGTSNPGVVVDILSSDHLTQYCGSGCALVGAFCQLRNRGFPSNTEIGSGPIASCSKCEKQWLTSIEAHEMTTVALVFLSCDGEPYIH